MIINAGCTYITSSGETVDYSEDIRWSDRHWGKYNNGIANYLDINGYGSPDEETGNVEWDVYVQRFGKRLLFTDNYGFVTVEKFPTVDAAASLFDEISADYSAWAE